MYEVTAEEEAIVVDKQEEIIEENKVNTILEKNDNEDMDINYDDNMIIDNNNKEKKIYIKIMKNQIIIICLVLSMCKMKY